MSGEVSRERLLALPKAELHVHLDGSLRVDTLLELGREAGVELPGREPGALASRMRAPDAGDLASYLEAFATTLSVLQTAGALERAAYELAEDAAAENVRYMEVRYSPVLHSDGGMSLEETVEAPLRGLSAAEETLGLRVGLIVCGIRSQPPSVSRELAELAVAYQDQGVVAFDLAGAEAGHPAREHREACRWAAEHHLPVTVHAGEAEGAWSIAQALHDCHARRIGHGTRLWEDPELEAFVNDFRIPLEVCLTSNVQTGVTPAVSRHPFRRYLDAGLVVTLNTDNRLISGTTLTREYQRAQRELGLDWDELTTVALMGFQAAFLPYADKVSLLEEVEKETARLHTE